MLKKDTLLFPFYRFEGQGVKSFIQLFSEYYLFLILFLLVSIINPSTGLVHCMSFNS